MPEETEYQLLRAQKPMLRMLQDAALNAEAPPDCLDEPITPISSFFVRNNGQLPSPQTDEVQWSLTVDGEVERPTTWTVADLKAHFEQVSLTAVLECAGNGRAFFSPPSEGLPWRLGAVGCARWTGIRLRDLLIRTGVKDSAVYTGHISPDIAADGSGKPALSRGLPIAKALAPDTLLAFAMNGEPLPYLHGGPLRIVAPGFPGSAWQKWLTRVWVREREHDGEKMTGTNYRLPLGSVDPACQDDTPFAVITDMPVKSLITMPVEGFACAAGNTLEVRGFAWSGHVPVSSMEISGNGGRTWVRTEREPAVDRFAWRRFRATLKPTRRGAMTIIARATDASGRSQPLDNAPWNPRGYCNNIVHRVVGEITPAD